MRMSSERTAKKVRIPEGKLSSIITPSLKKIGNAFSSNGYEIRIVGGAVRDILIGVDPKDIDLATNATPDEIQRILEEEKIKQIPTGLQHGTITAVVNSYVPIDEGAVRTDEYEITTLRVDKNTDGRHAEVEFTNSWKEDSARRDLTFNALSLSLDGVVYDYFGGIDDLKDKVSRFVGNPADRIQEDYLRILRYFRFQGRMKNPHWDSDILASIKEHAEDLKKISGERIWMEMKKILSNPNTRYEVLSMMDKTGVLHYINLPSKRLRDLKNLETNDFRVALAKLLNDRKDLDNVKERWKISNSNYKPIAFILDNRKYEKKFDAVFIRKMLTTPEIERTHVEALAKYFNKADVFNSVGKVGSLSVKGQDLIDLGMKPGPEMGKTLSALRKKWQDSDYKMSKEELLKTVKI